MAQASGREKVADHSGYVPQLRGIAPGHAEVLAHAEKDGQQGRIDLAGGIKDRLVISNKKTVTKETGYPSGELFFRR